MTTLTINAPHHAVEVTVIDGIIHRPGPYMTDVYTASCDPLETGRTMSAGWARHLGFALCEATGCYAPGEAVQDFWWIGARRRNSHYHRLRPAAKNTDCGKFAGLNDGVLDNGQFVEAVTVKDLNLKPCRDCWPVVAAS